jgi:hypothetical protein
MNIRVLGQLMAFLFIVSILGTSIDIFAAEEQKLDTLMVYGEGFLFRVMRGQACLLSLSIPDPAEEGFLKIVAAEQASVIRY